jgi:hypothetical protein
MGWFQLIRAFWPSIVATVGGVLAMLIVLPLRDAAGPFQSVVGFLALAPFAFLGFAFVYGGWVYYRFTQAEAGDGPICTSCGGPLGHERDGRYGDYRKCLACGTNVNNRHYT